MARTYTVIVNAPRNREYNAQYSGTISQLRFHFSTYLSHLRVEMPMRSIKQFTEALLYAISDCGVHDFSIEVIK